MSAGVPRPAWAQRRFEFVHPPWMLADFVERLRGVVPRLTPLLEGMGEEAAHNQVEGKWSVAQNIGHLSDVEELWQERLQDLRQGRKTYTAAVGARFQELAKRHQARPVDAILAELEDRRSRLVDALAQAPPELQEATAFHERLQVPLRLVDCAQFYAEHDDHHLLRIRTIRALLGGGVGLPTPPQVAVRRQPLPDGKEWSIYVLNGFATAVEVRVESASFEWGDRGHSVEHHVHIPVDAHSSALLLRVDDGDAEISMELSLRILSPSQDLRATFELGKLYHYRNPQALPHLGFTGWIRHPERVVNMK